MTRTSATLLTLLGQYSPLAKAILTTQCARLGLDPMALSAADLGVLMPALVRALELFGSPEKAGKFEADVQRSQLVPLRTKPSDPPSPRVDQPARDARRTSATYRMLLETLQHYTGFAANMLGSACEQLQLTPATVAEGDVPRLVDCISRRLERFAAPGQAAHFLRHFRSGARTSEVVPLGPRSELGDTFAPKGPLTPLATLVFEAMRESTPFAWPILNTHCARAGFLPAQLDEQRLRHVFAALVDAVDRFAGEKAALSLAARVRALVPSLTSGDVRILRGGAG